MLHLCSFKIYELSQCALFIEKKCIKNSTPVFVNLIGDNTINELRNYLNYALRNVDL